MKYTDLVSVLEDAGKLTCTVEVGGGSRVLLLTHGGRVLGLFSSKNEENFYWTNPLLESPQAARAFYASGEWENSGGDRTWLAPEVDIFFPAYPDLKMSGYFQPRQLDPGAYRVEHYGSGVVLKNRLSLPLYRAKTVVELEIAKWVAPTSNPLRHERALPMDGVEYSGYEQHTTLDVFVENAPPVGLWNLIQMPHEGELIVSTYAKTEPKIYFGDINSEDLMVRDHSIRWRMRASGEQKIGIRAAATTGRAGYRYYAGGQSVLIVRNFVVNPAGEYIDTPWTEPEDLGYSVQACNVNSVLGKFSELEYHAPAIGNGTGKLKCEDVSQVWAFRGKKQEIDLIATGLLGSET